MYNSTFELQRAATWSTDWVAFLWLRNMALGLVFYGGWHVFLYEIPKIREKVMIAKVALFLEQRMKALPC